MLVLCNGMPRSASTWSFNVARTLLASVGGAVHATYDEDLYRFFSKAPAEARHLVLKCHYLDPTGLTLVRAGAAKLIYTWRDPVDAVASYMAMFEPIFDKAIPIFKKSLDLLARHQAHGQALLVAYEQIMSDGATAVAHIASYLSVAADEARLAELADQFSLERMRDKVQEISDLDYGPNLKKHENSFYDPVTLLHVDHIRRGDIGYGHDRLSGAQVRMIRDMVRDSGCDLPNC